MVRTPTPIHRRSTDSQFGGARAETLLGLVGLGILERPEDEVAVGVCAAMIGRSSGFLAEPSFVLAAVVVAVQAQGPQAEAIGLELVDERLTRVRVHRRRRKFPDNPVALRAPAPDNDSRAPRAANQAEQRPYRTRHVDDDVPLGDWSDTVETDQPDTIRQSPRRSNGDREEEQRTKALDFWRRAKEYCIKDISCALEMRCGAGVLALCAAKGVDLAGGVMGGFKNGNSKSRSIAFLKSKLDLSEDQAKYIYESIRCGLIHEGGPKSGSSVEGDQSDEHLFYKDTKASVVVNCARLAHLVVEALESMADADIIHRPSTPVSQLDPELFPDVPSEYEMGNSSTPHW